MQIKACFHIDYWEATGHVLGQGKQITSQSSAHSNYPPFPNMDRGPTLWLFLCGIRHTVLYALCAHEQTHLIRKIQISITQHCVYVCQFLVL